MATINSISGSSKIKDTYTTIYDNDNALNVDLIALEDRVDNIVSQAGDDNTEIVDARQSAYYDETFTTLDGRLENIETRKAEETMITNSFHADPVKYYGNVKTIDDFQDISVWTNLLGLQSADSTNVKIGNKSLKKEEDDNASGNIESGRNISLDLSKLNNGEESPESDYINMVFYVSDATKFTQIAVFFSQNTGSPTTDSKYYTFPFVTGWNFAKVKKSDFLQTGAGAWSGIQSIRIRAATTVNAQGAYVSFQLLQLVKADPSGTYPNLFQEDFTINSGEWFVGEEFGRVVVKQIGSTNAVDALQQSNTYNDFIISSDLKAITNNTHGYVGFKSSGSVYCDIYSGNFRLIGVNEGVQSSPLQVLINDYVTVKLEKKGQSVKAIAYKNGAINESVQLTGTSNLENVSLVLGSKSTALTTTYLSASITEIPHAHHADIAEVAKGLTVKRQAGPFVADELNYGEYGIDTANNRLYVKKSDTEVIYFTGTVV